MPEPIFEKKNILVTGGAGFIGSHLCEDLLKSSKVICVDNFVSGSQGNIDHLLRFPDFIFLKHDINQPLELEKFPELARFRIEFQGIQEVYNLACPTSPKNFDQYKIDTIKANTVGLMNMLDLAIKYKAKFLHGSSSVVYGGRTDQQTIFKEDYLGILNQMSPRACYDSGKQYAEAIVNTYEDIHNLDAKIARIFRTYGPRNRLNDGEMMPDFIVNALDNKDLVIYGDDNFRTTLSYVTDLVDGLVRLMAAPADIGPVNLGSDVDLKLSDVARKIIDMTGSSSNVVFKEPLVFMTPLGIPDISRARDQLAWLPVFSLEKGLEKTIEYAKAEKVRKTI
ncbi:MAG TPA: NAD-dependent epimerase/dehydratase family protein [Patescibacteria group bacterium]